jgi:hypothetical protein
MVDLSDPPQSVYFSRLSAQDVVLDSVGMRSEPIGV